MMDNSDALSSWVDHSIRQAADKKSSELNLSYLGRAELPDAIFELTQLEVLNLAGNQLTSLPAGLDRLPRLKGIDVRDNPIEQITSRPGLLLDWSSYVRFQKSIDPTHIVGLGFTLPGPLPDAPLDRFPGLRALSFEGFPRPIDDWALQGTDSGKRKRQAHPAETRVLKWTRSDSRLAIDKILPSVPALQELDLYYLDLGSIPDSILALRDLVNLYLTGNVIRKLPAELSQLRRLRRLKLSDNEIEMLPEWLWTLADLNYLDVGFNQIRALPAGIGKLRNLMSLSLQANYLDSLPNAIAHLKRLRFLSLSDNLFASIPSSVFDLESIVHLQVAGEARGTNTTWSRGNQSIRGSKAHPPQLTEIPSDILRLNCLEELRVEHQPISTPPVEVMQGGIKSIKDYWRQRRDVGTDYLCEAKLLIIGEPGAGKTTLAHKLLDPTYPLDSGQMSTEGIDILRWQFPTALRPRDGGPSRALTSTFGVSIWDFGGQEIYHSTHQFFLTRRSVYVLVADSRKEDTDFQYWLNVVELLSDRSPLIVVKNEKQDRRRDIDESGLRSRFQSLRDVMSVNLDGNRGLEDLTTRIRQHLEALPHIGEALPATWKRVREALERDPREYITVEEYLRICEAHGFTRLADKLQLSGYLHDLGICLHFQDDLVLKNTVILKPKWGTDAVYRVLDDVTVVEQRGRFSRSKLDLIWVEDEYSGMRDELLQLMLRFQLCYRLENSDFYVAPQLLTPERPSYSWTSQGNLTLKYRYDFMPKGIFTRLIVALNHLIADQSLVWRTGAILERDGTRCELIEDYPRREITLRAVGQYPRELIAIVDHELGRIHGSFQHFKCETWVPCRCGSCSVAAEPQLYSFEVLRRFAQDAKSIQCHASYELVNARELVDAVFSRGGSHAVDRRHVEETLRPDGGSATRVARATEGAEVFVSYGWGGESEELVDALSTAFSARGVALRRDKSEMTYKESIRRFMRRIGSGNAIVIVLSRKYLESPNCMFELVEIAEYPDFKDRVFPIILSDACVFDSESVLDYVKYWEGRIKSLDAKMRTVELTNLEGVQDDINLYRRIRSTIAHLVDVLRDMNVRSVDSNRDTLLEEVVAAVESRLGRDRTIG